jgi:hypothetical protein
MTDQLRYGVWQTRVPPGESVWPPMWDTRTGQPVWGTSAYDWAAVPEPRRPWWRRLTARFRRAR